MAKKYSSGKYALANCDVCGFQYGLSALKPIMDDGKPTGILACAACWDDEHPQDDLGKYPVDDPQALRDPRPDTGLIQSREINWGWNPTMAVSGVGGVGAVTVTVTVE